MSSTRATHPFLRAVPNVSMLPATLSRRAALEIVLMIISMC